MQGTTTILQRFKASYAVFKNQALPPAGGQNPTTDKVYYKPLHFVGIRKLYVATPRLRDQTNLQVGFLCSFSVREKDRHNFVFLLQFSINIVCRHRCAMLRSSSAMY